MGWASPVDVRHCRVCILSPEPLCSRSFLKLAQSIHGEVASYVAYLRIRALMLRLFPSSTCFSGLLHRATGPGPFPTMARYLLLPEELRHCFPEGPPEDSLSQGFGASFCDLDVSEKPCKRIEERPGCLEGVSPSGHLPPLLEGRIPEFRPGGEVLQGLFDFSDRSWYLQEGFR